MPGKIHTAVTRVKGNRIDVGPTATLNATGITAGLSCDHPYALGRSAHAGEDWGSASLVGLSVQTLNGLAASS